MFQQNASIDETEMTNQIGFMQGRLSSVSKEGVIQEFPWETWKEEFSIAKECGFKLIEWIFESRDWERNPILLGSGRKEIIQLQKTYGIKVDSICCDYFMDHPLFENTEKSQQVLENLIEASSEVGIRFIELPFIGKAAIHNDNSPIIIKILNAFVPFIKEKGVNLLLEVSISPEKICKLLDRIPSQRIQLNYDTGNSAYWGYHPEDEIPVYGHRIGNIHIKDCTPADYSVPLGEGNVDFELIFNLLKEIKYQGNFVLQTARGKDDVSLAGKYYKFTQSYIQRYLR